MNKTLSHCQLLLAIIFVGGCASKPAVVDNSPILRTAQITTEFTSSGLKGLFAHKGTSSSVTYENMRRIDRGFKFTNRKKNYQECPLGGCEGQGPFQGAVYDAETEDDFEEEEDASCIITMSDMSFNIKKTGQQRTLNGFPAEEYLIDWRANGSDDQGGKLENLFEMNIWTTPVTPVISEALGMQEQFNTNYYAAINDGYPESMQKAIPREAMALLTRYFIDTLEEADVAKLKSMMGNTIPIEGFPVSRKVKWDARNNTCSAPPEPKEEEKGRLNTGSLKGLIASVGKELVDQEIEKKKAEKAREFELAPIFLYVEDVTSIQMADTRESRLTVPANYKLITRR